MDNVHVWCLCSAKGGAGKTDMAVLAARALAGQGREVLFLDADLLASSLVYDLELEAPDLPGDPLDLRAARRGFASRQWSLATVELRNARAEYGAAGAAFLQDALLLKGMTSDLDDCRMDQVWWQCTGDSVRWLPASPALPDVRIMEQFMLRRTADISCRLRSLIILSRLKMPGLTDVVVDFPDGMSGFAVAMLRALVDLLENPVAPDVRWCPRALMVLSEGHLKLGEREFGSIVPWFPRLLRVVPDCGKRRLKRLTELDSHYGLNYRSVPKGADAADILKLLDAERTTCE